MVKHEDLMQQTLLNREGYIFAIDDRHPKFPQAIAATGSLNPEYVNVLAAAGLLYRTIAESVVYMERLVEFLEVHGHEDAVPSLTAVQATFDSALKIAINGLPKKLQNDKNSS